MQDRANTEARCALTVILPGSIYFIAIVIIFAVPRGDALFDAQAGHGCVLCLGGYRN
jgi:hypothetical protein